MTANKKDPAQLAAWLREERRILSELTRLIRGHVAGVAEKPPERWLPELEAALRRLCAHLRSDFEAQETQGFFENLVLQRPGIARQVEQLRHEHEELLRLGDWLLRDVGQTRPQDRLIIADLCARVSRYLAVLAQHDQCEATLTLVVFNEDLGAGD